MDRRLIKAMLPRLCLHALLIVCLLLSSIVPSISYSKIQAVTAIITLPRSSIIGYFIKNEPKVAETTCQVPCHEKDQRTIWPNLPIELLDEMLSYCETPRQRRAYRHTCKAFARHFAFDSERALHAAVEALTA